MQTTDLINSEIKGTNTSQSIVSPSSQLYSKNVLEKIEFLKDQTKNEVIQNNDIYTPDIGEKDFNAKGQDSGPSSKKTVEKTGETKEEAKKK